MTLKTKALSKPNYFILGLTLFIVGCGSSYNASITYDYGTESDSARYYFQKGWEEILDNGRWTASEIAFRKAVEFDSNWILGKSLVGRITRNTQEKERILKEIQLGISEISGTERALAEVNLLSIAASVNQNKGIPNTPEFNERRRQIAEKNFGDFARKYPEDDYFKAEYIEFLHANHGTQTALDSLKALALPRQRQLGFYISYQAILELELGNLDNAIKLSQELNKALSEPSYLSPKMLKVQILLAQDSLVGAKQLVDEVVAADSNHFIAAGTQARIKELIKDR